MSAYINAIQHYTDDVICFLILRESRMFPTGWFIWWLWCQKQVSQAGISNCIPQHTVGCNYLSLPEIPASGDKVFISYLQISILIEILLHAMSYSEIWPIFAKLSGSTECIFLGPESIHKHCCQRLGNAHLLYNSVVLLSWELPS